METKLFKRKKAILNDIIGRMFIIGLHMLWADTQNMEIIDWVMLSIAALMAISIVLEIMRLYRPYFEIKNGNQLVFVGIFKRYQIAKVNFGKRLGQHWIALESIQKKKVGNLVVKDLDQDAIKALETWV